MLAWFYMPRIGAGTRPAPAVVTPLWTSWLLRLTSLFGRLPGSWVRKPEVRAGVSSWKLLWTDAFYMMHPCAVVISPGLLLGEFQREGLGIFKRLKL